MMIDGLEEGSYCRTEPCQSLIVGRIQNRLAQVLPEALDQIQVRRVGRKVDHLNTVIAQPLLHLTALIVASIIADHGNAAFGVTSLQLLEECDRRVRIDAL